MNTAFARPNIIAVIVAAIVCCIHFGFSEFVSVQFLCFVATAITVFPELLKQAPRLSVVAAILGLAVLLGWYFAGHDGHLVFKGIRTIAVLLILIAWQRRSISISIVQCEIVQRAVLVACAFSLALATAQLADSLSVNSGAFDIPESLFALDYGTLFSGRRADLASGGYVIRPSALFSEPSALAALGVLGVFISYAARNSLLRVIGFSVVIVSQSLSGLLLAVAIVVFSASTKRDRNIALWLLIPCLIAGFVYLSSFLGGGRVGAVLSGADVSARIRLFEPMNAILTMLREGMFFGASPDALLGMAPADVGTIFDNWMLNQVLLYGVMGLIWIGIPFLYLKKSLWLLLIAYMVTNGDVFYYDRYLFLLLGAIAVSKVGLAKK